MGTSASLGGIGGGSPLIPDWVDDIDGDPDESTDETSPDVDEADSDGGDFDLPASTVPVAPRGHLASARRSLGNFAATGDRQAMRRGVANYVRTGRGGVQTATRRSAGSASRGASLAGIIGGNPAFEDVRQRIRNAVDDLSNADELLAAIAEAASPSDGTNDSQTGQDAAAEALQYLLERDDTVDLFDLAPNQKEIVLERFLAIDAFELFMTDVSKHMQSKGTLADYQNRIRVIKDYFCETFRQANQKRGRDDRATLGRVSDDEVLRLSRSIIAEAYMIFEGVIDEN